jgi:hypothetical protein
MDGSTAAARSPARRAAEWVCHHSASLIGPAWTGHGITRTVDGMGTVAARRSCTSAIRSVPATCRGRFVEDSNRL